jgi:hypothetical protein
VCKVGKHAGTRNRPLSHQGLSAFIKTEIARDSWLLQNGIVKMVEWHFYFSEASQSIGPSMPLLDALHKAGIKVVIHF